MIPALPPWHLEVCHIFDHWTNTLKMQHSREFQPGLHKTLAFCIGWTSSLLSNCISHLRRTISHWKLSASKSANRLVLCYIQWMISQLMWRLLGSIQIWSIPGLGNAQWECLTAIAAETSNPAFMIAIGSGSAVETDLVCNMLILPCSPNILAILKGSDSNLDKPYVSQQAPLKPTRRQVLKELSGGNKAFSVPCTPQVAGHRIPVSRAEAMEAKHFGDPGLRLLGFKCLGRWPDFKGPAGIRDDQRDQRLS